ncbi:MAG: thiamine pyrophosphate-dependent enzyme [Gemmataceae bacterium]
MAANDAGNPMGVRSAGCLAASPLRAPSMACISCWARSVTRESRMPSEKTNGKPYAEIRTHGLNGGLRKISARHRARDLPMSSGSLPVLTPQDFASDQEVRWCPGCGDFAILGVVKHVLAGLGMPRERFVFVSGIGCAGRFPYYLNTYGFHGIHGQATAIATGLKVANPELSVWVVVGDGDALAPGASHLIHALRRNVDIKVLVVNNEVCGLTKGQSSPTSRHGTRTRSNPEGSFETPLRPVSLALAAEATFVARSIDVEVEHLAHVLQARRPAPRLPPSSKSTRTARSSTTACRLRDRSDGEGRQRLLPSSTPASLLFGKDRNQGIRLFVWSLRWFLWQTAWRWTIS